MSYCTPTVEATVRYKFGSSTEFKTYKTKQTPIDITTEQYTPLFASGQCPIQYWVDYTHTYRYIRSPFDTVTWLFSAQPSGQPIYGQILDIFFNYAIGERCGGKNSVRGATILYRDYRNGVIRTGGQPPKTVTPASDSYPFNDLWTNEGWVVNSITPVQQQLDNCGTPKPVCTIKVLHKGQVIFIDKGDCPITFNVTCGEECPPGTTKCRKSDFPGYCCLPCSSTAAEIINIKNIVQNVNKNSVSYG